MAGEQALSPNVIRTITLRRRCRSVLSALATVPLIETVRGEGLWVGRRLILFIAYRDVYSRRCGLVTRYLHALRARSRAVSELLVFLVGLVFGQLASFGPAGRRRG